ncbi:MAG: hypothetical protein Q7S02_00530, partial [bacterium]|nr:hypothetical protein [bacterium]
MLVTRKTWLMIGEMALVALIVFGAAPALAGGEGDRPWYSGFTPILLLLGAIAIVIWRMPAVKEDFFGQLAHTRDTRYR